jgi:hypothetical protein
MSTDLRRPRAARVEGGQQMLEAATVRLLNAA